MPRSTDLLGHRASDILYFQLRSCVVPQFLFAHSSPVHCASCVSSFSIYIINYDPAKRAFLAKNFPHFSTYRILRSFHERTALTICFKLSESITNMLKNCLTGLFFREIFFFSSTRAQSSAKLRKGPQKVPKSHSFCTENMRFWEKRRDSKWCRDVNLGRKDLKPRRKILNWG